jgi:hypothetical protein
MTRASESKTLLGTALGAFLLWVPIAQSGGSAAAANIRKKAAFLIFLGSLEAQ